MLALKPTRAVSRLADDLDALSLKQLTSMDPLTERACLKCGKGTGTNTWTETHYVEPTATNASGHVQEVDRNFNDMNLAGVGIVAGST